ncbi:MAG: hypothetical protein VX833_08955 [Actinomycetota bacterium]|nr:hypothetical protein [Actinomycetota bacterium]
MDDERPRTLPEREDEGSSLPHTPPLGIRAVRPGEEPPVVPSDPVPALARRERPVGNWLAALVATGGAVLSIIGTFLPWKTETRNSVSTDLIGWDQAGLAVAVLLVGLVAAGATGALWAGQRGVALKASLLITGAVLFAITGLEITDVNSADALTGKEVLVGFGLPTVMIGGALLMVAALLDRGPWKFGPISRA